MGKESSRLPLVPFADWDDDTRETLLRYLRRPEIYLGDDPDAPPMPSILEMFANHVRLGDTWMTFSAMLISEDATVPVRERELAILRVGWLMGSPYEWYQHVRMGRDAGLTPAELHAVPQGSGDPVWGDADRALLDACDEIVLRRGTSEATWNALVAILGTKGAFELLFVIASYQCLAAVMNSIALPADPPTEEIDAPDMPDDVRFG